MVYISKQRASLGPPATHIASCTTHPPSQTLTTTRLAQHAPLSTASALTKEQQEVMGNHTFRTDGGCCMWVLRHPTAQATLSFRNPSADLLLVKVKPMAGSWMPQDQSLDKFDWTLADIEGARVLGTVLNKAGHSQYLSSRIIARHDAGDRELDYTYDSNSPRKYSNSKNFALPEKWLPLRDGDSGRSEGRSAARKLLLTDSQREWLRKRDTARKWLWLAAEGPFSHAPGLGGSAASALSDDALTSPVADRGGKFTFHASPQRGWC